MRPFLFYGMGLLLAAVTAARAAEQRFSSGDTRVSLVELYTSEGCSSCPSAERWLAGLRDAPGLWRDFVPIALHVDYWDGLGWPDRFATREFTQRQQAYSAAWGSNSVYTPGFVRDGVEWKNSARPPVRSPENVGTLTVTLKDRAQGRAEFSPAKARSGGLPLEIHVALLGSGLTSKVTAGENRGETLRHEFVVLAIATHALSPGEEGRQQSEFTLPASKIVDGERRALAIWVTRRGNPTPIQATGGWLASE